MVPVTGLLTNNFASQLRGLEAQFAPTLKLASPEAAFIHYLFAQLPPECRPTQWPVPVAPTALNSGMAPELATLGILSAVNPTATVVGMYGPWRASFSRLQNKEPFPIDRQSFTLRPVEFLGICVGARKITGKQSAESEWLRGLIPEQRKQIQGHWSVWFSSTANVVLSDTDDLRESVNFEELQIHEVALLMWLRAGQSSATGGFWKTIDLRSLHNVVLERCATATLEDMDPARAAVTYAALKLSVLASLRSALADQWQVNQSQKDALEIVTSLCRRFHRMAQQLLVRHGSRSTLKIKDEYDVQDLMHAMLLLFFDDVREETWTPNYAGNSSRTDFVLWKESVVIEVKMTRKNLGQKEVANQLIIDKERYSSDTRCETLICFVYDPSGRCANPTALENDLAQDDRPKTRVIVYSGRN